MQKLICPKCKAENDPKSQFCQICGTTLVPPAPEKTVAAKRTQAAVQAPPPPPPYIAPPPPAPQSIPPAPAYGQPPSYAYPPAPYYSMGTPFKDLGLRVDGWSDVVENGADLAESVKQVFAEMLAKQNIPGLRITNVTLINEDMESRPYQLVTAVPGTTIPVRVAPFGKNLAISWDLYTRRSANWLTIGLLGGIVLTLAVLDVIFTPYYNGAVFTGIFGFISTLLNWLLLPTLFLLLLGKIIKDDWLGLFVKETNAFASDDAVALSTVVDDSLAEAVEECAMARASAPKPVTATVKTKPVAKAVTKAQAKPKTKK